MWTKQRTRQGDTLSTLARDYGVSVEQILSANGVNAPSQQTDRYLSQQAQAYMIPMNLPRAKLAKLVMERDIHKWVRAIGGDCEPIREGSMTQVARLTSCAPGAYCRFTSDTEINLPMRKRIATLSGLGAVNVMDTVAYLNGLKQQAAAFAKSVVDDADHDRVEDAETWAQAFIAGVNGKVNVATRADDSGVPAFMRDPNLIQKVADYIKMKTEEAKAQKYSTSIIENVSTFFSNVQSGVASALRTVADAVAPGTAPASTATPAATPATAKTAAAPAPSVLDGVRAGTAVVKRGQKGAAVTAVQILLSEKLPKAKLPKDYTVDADFGGKTEAAVKAFQTAASLAVNGVVDKSTLQALEAAPGINTAMAPTSSGGGGGGGEKFVATSTTLDMVRSGSGTFSRPQSGPGVRELQALLNDKGFRDERGRTLGLDSLFGKHTQAAVKNAQSSKGLPVTGILDRTTLQAIEAPTATTGPQTGMALQVGKDNTMLYVGLAAGALILAAVAVKKAKRGKAA